MTSLRSKWAVVGFVLMAGLLAALPAQGQETFSGVVASSTRDTLVVRGENGQFQLFVFDRDTVRPRTLAAGSRVRVTSRPSDERGIRVAEEVVVETTAAQQRSAQPEQVVPPEIRRVERDIERQARRYQAGVRAGVGLDPEVVLLGAHAQVGPFFSPDVFVRPNVEFAYGEVTTLFAFNLEAIYRLPVSSRAGRWSTYFGAGPAFTLLHQNFERTTGEDRDIDFGDFSSDFGLNLLGGIRYRTGMFVELKASVYARPAPTLRLILGYNF
jgi:hypothetical protein